MRSTLVCGRPSALVFAERLLIADGDDIVFQLPGKA